MTQESLNARSLVDDRGHPADDLDGPGFEGRPPTPGSPAPTTGAWRPGDPIGHRQFARLGELPLEAADPLPDVVLAYETWGTLNAARDNAILVLHALTGDSHIRGDAGPGHPTAGWWTHIIGPGCAIDTDRYFVVAPNVLGGCQGSTGPASLAPDGKAWGSRFPFLTIRDQVAAEALLSDQIGIEQWSCIIGGSMGGMRVMEWAATYPERVGKVIAIATSAAATGDQIAWAHAQLGAIRADPNFLGGDYYDAPAGQGPAVGLGIARQIAHTTYRSSHELDTRFGTQPQGTERPLGGGGRYAVQSYLEYHANKLALRFDANSYLVLTEAMCSHDLGRERGSIEEALRCVTASTLVIAVDSDRLFMPEQSALIAANVAHCAGIHLVHSDFGHDGFLIEFEQLDPLIRGFLC